MKKNNLIIEKAKTAQKETKYIEFKEKIDLNMDKDWCEIIKDIVAITNSGGGCILFGIKNDGTYSEFDITNLFKIDPSKVTDKIAKYTNQQFSDFEIEKIEIRGRDVVALIIYSSPIPIVFVKPGTYNIGEGKQETAFARGTVYFRHGAKSEPGNSQDLEECIKREIERNRIFWLGNIRKVVKAPIGYMVKVLPPTVIESKSKKSNSIRIVDDPNAPAYRKIDSDQAYPYRQKEVVQIVNQKLNGKKTINAY